MTCTLQIQEELLTKHLEYKYVIFSPKVIGKDECYEFLHSFAGYQYPDPNRYLHIDKTKCLHGGKSGVLNALPYVHLIYFWIEEYHQYDMVVYPKVAEGTKGLGDRIKAGFKAGFSFFGSLVGLPSSTQAEGVKEVEFKPPSREQLASQCLQFYLEPYKKVLLQEGGYPSEYKVDVMVFEITHIYSVLREPGVNGCNRTIILDDTVSPTL